MGLACLAKPQSPGTVRLQGGGPEWLSCCGQAVWAAIGVEPGAQAVGNWRADRERATGLDRSHLANGTPVL